MGNSISYWWKIEERQGVGPKKNWTIRFGKVMVLGLYSVERNLLVFGRIIEDGKESHLMKKVRKSENM